MNEPRHPDWIPFVQPGPCESTGTAESTAVLELEPEFEASAELEKPRTRLDVTECSAAHEVVRPRQTRRRKRPETRAQLLERLVNPQISLHEASVLLNVCPATVRGYTRSGRLPDIRTPGGQRRFRFRDIMLLARELDHKK